MMRRREFLKASLMASGAFVLGVNFTGCTGTDVRRMRETARSSGGFQPNAFVTITPDDRVLVAVGKTEMGQGVFTSHAMLVAEELEVDLDSVEPYHATGEEFGAFGVQITGGSTSLKDSFIPMREAGAAAREMFVAAAAEVWECPTEECRAENGHIVHTSGKSLRYGELTEAASRQSIPSSPTLKKSSEFKVIGQGKTRVDLVSKITGEATFGIDVQVEGMTRALILKPPVLGSTVASLNADKARDMDGVVAIFAFERGVAVVADKYWQAKRAARHVKVEWNLSKLENFDTESLRKDARKQVIKRGSSIRDDGDVDAVFRDHDTVVEAIYESPYLAHAPLEPMNAMASVEPDRAEIWAPVQWQSAVQGDVANMLDLSRDKVEVHTVFPGGGFGRRLMIDFVIEAVMISREVQRPVHLIWSREDDTRGGYYRPYNITRLKGALDSDGRPRAFYYHSMSQSLLNLRDWMPSILPEWMPRVVRTMLARTAGNAVESDTLPNFLATEGANDLSYAIDDVRIEYSQIHVDVPVTFWRSVGHSYNGFVIEGFIDELAHAADQDPYAFRRNILHTDPRKLAALDKVAELAGWGSSLDEGWGRGIAVHKSFDTYCAQVIEAGVFDGVIKVRKVWCVVDCGVVVNPDIVRAQMESCIAQGLAAAIFQKIDFVDGRVVQGNFDTFELLRLTQMPEVVVEIVDSDADPTGVGEPGLPPVAPALAGAIFDATGQRLRRMPFQDALAEAP